MPTDSQTDILAGRLVNGMTFNEKVWAVCARVPRGKVTTYAAIARKLGTQAYRAVGNAMNKTPSAPPVPGHRVGGSDGSPPGCAAGLEKKTRLLKAEGVTFNNGKVDLKMCAATL
jgi:methylated-DNA-[protein]-cysteine S-methyltransferase